MNNQLISDIKKHIQENKRIIVILLILVPCLFLLVRSWTPRSLSREQSSNSVQGAKTRPLHLTPEILNEHPIQLSPLSEVEPSEEVLLPGRIQKDPTQTRIVTARAQGRITEIKVKEADEVRAGQILAVIQSTEVAQAQSEHLKTFLRYELAERQLDRSKELFEHQIISAKEFELVELEFKSEKAQLGASRTRLTHLNLTKGDIEKLERESVTSGELMIRSPIAGAVIERKAALGQSVTADDSLFTIGRTDHVLIVLDVYEKDIPLLNEGMAAEVLIPTNSGHPKIILAKVARISQEIDSMSRSAKVWLDVKNKSLELKFGQAINARILGVNRDKVDKKIMAIPIDGVHQIEGESIVFVKTGEYDFEPRKVDLGWTSDKWVEVRNGLKAGEKVVTQGSFILKSEFLKN